jgi:large subunit ribosomal protein L23
MAKKKETTENATVATATQTNVPAKNSAIIRPRITEKAARGSEKGAYVFDVAMGATKNEIKKAFKTLYNVTPVKVNTITQRQRYDFVRGRLQTVRATKKAYVILPKGVTITL